MLDVSLRSLRGNFLIDAAFRSETAGVTALFGRSGAGKTSIINMVAGLLRPDQGHIIAGGRYLFDSKTRTDLAPEKRRVGYVFQEARLFPHLSVRTNLTYGMRLTPKSQRYVEFDQVVALLGIEALLDRRPAKLSGGEKQRVAIGRAILTSPSILLMDEPLASLDFARKAEVLPFIARLGREFSVPILYVSHSLEEILNLADAIVVMEAGRTVAAGKIEELMSRPDLQSLTGYADCGAILSTVVQSHNGAGGVSCLHFEGGILKVPQLDVSIGSKVRVRIEARSVAIALSPPEQTSVQNIIPATIEEITRSNGSFVDVKLDIGCPLAARITPLALTTLDLKPGMRVFAVIKSVSVSHGMLWKQ